MGHAGITQALIDAGSDVDHSDTNGYHCIDLAAAVKNIAAIKLLLNAGANPNTGDTVVGWWMHSLPVLAALMGVVVGWYAALGLDPLVPDEPRKR